MFGLNKFFTSCFIAILFFLVCCGFAFADNGTAGEGYEKVSVDYTFSFATTEIGQPVTINYEIKGGSGQFDQIWYGMSEITEHCVISEYDSGEDLASAEGTFTVVPKCGEYFEVNVCCHDQETGLYWTENYSEQIVCNPNPNIPVSIYDISPSPSLNEPFTFRYSIGGEKEIDEARAEVWVFARNDTYPDCVLKQELEDKAGEITYIPKTGNQLYIAIRGKDTEGNPFYVKTDRIKISEMSETDIIKILLNQTEVTVGDTVSGESEVLDGRYSIVDGKWIGKNSDYSSSLTTEHTTEGNREVFFTTAANFETCFLEITYMDENGNLYVMQSEPVTVNEITINISTSGLDENNRAEIGKPVTLSYDIPQFKSDWIIEIYWSVDLGGEFTTDTAITTLSQDSGTVSYVPTRQAKSFSYNIRIKKDWYELANVYISDWADWYQVIDGGQELQEKNIEINIGLAEVTIGDNISAEYEVSDPCYTIVIVKGTWIGKSKGFASTLNTTHTDNGSQGEFSCIASDYDFCFLEIVYQDENGNLYLEKSDLVNINDITVELIISGIDENNKAEIGSPVTLTYSIPQFKPEWTVEIYWYIDLGGEYPTQSAITSFSQNTGAVTFMPTIQSKSFSYHICIKKELNEIKNLYIFDVADWFHVVDEHTWGQPQYSWSKDHLTVTAYRECEMNPEHTETMTVDTSMQIVSPTEQAEGQVYRVATFESEVFETQVKEIMTVPALRELAVLRLPSSLKTIEENAFAGLACQAVIIPEGCSAIGAKAFADCIDLIYISIPADTEVSDDAFSGSPNVIIDQK